MNTSTNAVVLRCGPLTLEEQDYHKWWLNLGGAWTVGVIGADGFLGNRDRTHITVEGTTPEKTAALLYAAILASEDPEVVRFREEWMPEAKPWGLIVNGDVVAESPRSPVTSLRGLAGKLPPDLNSRAGELEAGARGILTAALRVIEWVTTGKTDSDGRQR